MTHQSLGGGSSGAFLCCGESLLTQNYFGAGQIAFGLYESILAIPPGSSGSLPKFLD